jgi:hypothetical protein
MKNNGCVILCKDRFEALSRLAQLNGVGLEMDDRTLYDAPADERFIPAKDPKYSWYYGADIGGRWVFNMPIDKSALINRMASC